MSTLLFGIALSALLSTTSFLVVIFRVSPLSAPMYALPAFFCSLFLMISSLASLAFFGIWQMLPFHTWDAGKILSMSVREGIFLGMGTVFLVIFHLLGLLTWWITLLIYAVFVLIEIAIQS